MSETVTVFRAVQSVINGGLNHKSTVVRAEVARLLDMVVCALGSARVMGCSREFHELLIPSCAKLLTDSSLEVRTHTKHLFSELIKHDKFDGLLKETLREYERQDIQKALDSLNKP